MHQIQPILYVSLRSPFARRIRLALHRLNIPYEERMIDVFQDNPGLMAANPLGLIPTLITESGPITDSRNILDYLGCLNVSREMKQVCVWIEGVIQSTVLYFQEAHLHTVPSPRWLEEHTDSINNTLAVLAKAPHYIWFESGSETLTQAAWDLAVALEYLELRIPEIEWKEKYPTLVKVLSVARSNDFFAATKPPK